MVSRDIHYREMVAILTRVIGYGAHSMAASNGSHAPSGTTVLGMQSALGESRTEFNGSRDHARLSEIAASATNLGAFMSREKQIDNSMLLATDEKQLGASGAGLNPLSTSPSIQSAASLTMSQTLELLHQPSSSPSLSQLRQEHESREPGRSFDKPHSRAQKVRGKLTDSRRQEVLSVRKKGACIRCRMLRKTVRYDKTFSFLASRLLKTYSVVEKVHARRVLRSSVLEYGNSTASGHTYIRNWTSLTPVCISNRVFHSGTEVFRRLRCACIAA